MGIPEIVGLVVTFLGGGAVSWLITHKYYRRASVSPPEWALPLIERFPISKPTKEQLIEFYNDALEDGEVSPHPLLGYLGCPECGTPAKEFREQAYDVLNRTVVTVSCPNCDWSEQTDI